MAISTTNFRFVQPAWDNLRYSKNGIVGRDITRRGQYVANMARIQVGVDTGALRRTIRTETHTASGMGPVAIISAGGPTAPHALMHHEGTRPHEIRPNPPRSVLKFTVGGRTVYATRVLHPGTRENKYLTDHLPMAVRI